MSDAVFGSEVFIVDDDATVCASLSMAFGLEGFRVATFADGLSFIAAARTRSPACVLLDVHMPGKSGLDILQELEGRDFPAPILIMSGRGDIPTAVEAIRRGALDFVEKRSDAGAIVARVREAIDAWGRRRRLRESGALPMSFPGSDRLTAREREVLSHIAAAASNREAAEKLGISKRTVEIHRGHIMQKLGAKNSVDLMRIVMTNGRHS